MLSSTGENPPVLSQSSLSSGVLGRLELCRALPWQQQGWIWDQGAVPWGFYWHSSPASPCALPIFIFFAPLTPLVTLGIFFAVTQHPQLRVLGVLRLMRAGCPGGRDAVRPGMRSGGSVASSRGRFISALPLNKNCPKIFWHLGERLGSGSRGTLSSVEQGSCCATEQRL